jgi:hypothetical protein
MLQMQTVSSMTLVYVHVLPFPNCIAILFKFYSTDNGSIVQLDKKHGVILQAGELRQNSKWSMAWMTRVQFVPRAGNPYLCHCVQADSEAHLLWG